MSEKDAGHRATLAYLERSKKLGLKQIRIVVPAEMEDWFKDQAGRAREKFRRKLSVMAKASSNRKRRKRIPEKKQEPRPGAPRKYPDPN